MDAMNQSRLTVPDMTCAACVTTIEGALQALPGVDEVDVDLNRKLVTIDHDASQVPTGQLAAAIEEQGYEVAEQEAA